MQTIIYVSDVLEMLLKWTIFWHLLHQFLSLTLTFYYGPPTTIYIGAFLNKVTGY